MPLSSLFTVLPLTLPLALVSQDSQGKQLAQNLLKNFGGSSHLKGLRVELTETIPSTPGEKEKVQFKTTFSMAFPHRFRAEETRPDEGLRLYLWEGAKILMGPGGGPFVEIEGKARSRILARFQLLAVLFCWDLIPVSPTSSRPNKPSPTLKGMVLHSTLIQPGKLPPLPIQRVFGRDQRLQRLIVGKQQYRTSGKLPGSKGTLPGTFHALPSTTLKIRGWASDFSFHPRFFRPHQQSTSKKTLIQQGGERKNFASPSLKRLPPAFEISLKDPGNWKSRAQILDKLGRQLFALGQEPAGLPLYGTDQKIRIQFVPSEGKKAKAPKAFKIRRLKKRIALVLYRKGSFTETMNSLEQDLRKKAQEMGIKKAGLFLVIPIFFPNPGGPFPGEKTPITLRGELLLER
jgi:hypothetical protein